MKQKGWQIVKLLDIFFSELFAWKNVYVAVCAQSILEVWKNFIASDIFARIKWGVCMDFFLNYHYWYQSACAHVEKFTKKKFCCCFLDFLLWTIIDVLVDNISVIVTVTLAVKLA